MKTIATPLPGLAAAVVLLACSGLGRAPHERQSPAIVDHTPVVFVSGVTGTKLRNPRTGAQVWGGVRQLVRPRDGGYSLALPLAVVEGRGATSPGLPQTDYEATGPIWQLRFPGWTKEVYRPLRERFEEAGYRLGNLASPSSPGTLFFFDYDWRYGNLHSVRQLDQRLTALSEAAGITEVDLVCQSNAAKICRWLTKYGTLDPESVEAGAVRQQSYRIRKLVLAGVSNNGALRVLRLLIQGRSYIPLVGRRFHPETFFTIRPLFEDLPAHRDDLFFDEDGKTLSVDLFDAQNWLTYGWSIFGADAVERLRGTPRSDLFGNRQQQLDYLAGQLDHSRRFQSLLARNADQFPRVRYFLLENESAPTIDRALLTRRNGEWRTWFSGDRRIDRNPALARLAAAPGDGHAVLASQRGLSPQESAALTRTVTVDGGHFEAVIQPQALDAILTFLREPADPEL